MSEIRASRNPSSSKTDFAAATRRARDCDPLRERGLLGRWPSTDSAAGTVLTFTALPFNRGPNSTRTAWSAYLSDPMDPRRDETHRGLRRANTRGARRPNWIIIDVDVSILMSHQLRGSEDRQ
ncbi:hypothetical protein FAGKG844_280050 [Frankia sp. AgKG'84/4]